ncbi:Cytochrome c-type biogenesis protein CcmF [Vibrio stylophorae]|uniref:Cytochrome c-type biogenesis protein CcmF n=1 Tax=Vibrio stylophorae TaxID=659351 RepID=A0ABM8ZUS6_9VIBR|nr:heme lyase CcmF/NrfE family subunit [Vibrio stylophorae]CAH0534077.1 Cytochrome c-type biogenesis protein CcmF [Vibrio stylophorae]
MIAELGHFALILALGLSILLSFYPLYGAQRGILPYVRLARPLSYGMFAALLLSFLCLLYAFYSNDFTLNYVASNSNSLLPWYYRLTAVWGAHEGSLLLWVLIQSLWAVAVARFSRGMPDAAVARVLAVMGMICVGFLLFILLTSNPFTRTLPLFPVDGRDLNPLLQDPGLIIHPPMLYMGYVGFSVAFAFAIASLMTGRLDTAWARWSRPWTQAAWLFLTLGIALGSWWAYYELGWGGWWFWDPVENASLMPWLAGTALMHSLAVTEKRGTFKAWTVFLAIAAFSLSLLGTFLVRSGVLVSVHAFASDPARGMFILGFLVVVIGGSLLLYALKGAQVRTPGNYQLFSRENMLLGNNLLLVASLIVVLLGTLLPLFHKSLGLGSISIGKPFFDSLFAWLMLPFALLLGVGPLVRWRKDNWRDFIKPSLIMGLIAALLTAFCMWQMDEPAQGMTAMGIFLAWWIVLWHGYETYLRATHRHSLATGLGKLGNSHWAMVLGHIGLAVTMIGITLTENHGIERDVLLKPGQHVEVAGYDFTFKGLLQSDGPNYQGFTGQFNVTHDDHLVAILNAEKRFYDVQRSMMTEAAIDWGLTRDLYVALGAQVENNAWEVRVYYKPFIRWIWGGSILMAIAALIALTDKRYRFRKTRTAKQADEKA